MWWCFGCYFCLPVVFTILCQMATRNVNSDSEPAQKQHGPEERSSGQKRQQHQAVERQLNCTLLALAVVYGVCVLPEHVCNITLAYTGISVAEETAAMLTLLHHFLLFFKSSVTPVLLLCLCKVSGVLRLPAGSPAFAGEWDAKWACRRLSGAGSGVHGLLLLLLPGVSASLGSSVA